MISRPSSTRKSQIRMEIEHKINGAQLQNDNEIQLQEMSVSPAPIEPMTLQNPPKNLHRLISACCWQLILGMTDGVVGALLPSIEVTFKVSYAVVSLIWLGNALGFIVIAFSGHYIDAKIGKHKMALLSSFCFLVAYSILSAGHVFALVCISYFLCGLGGSMGVALFNLFVSRLENSSKWLGIFHGCYGVGAFIAPLMGTLIVDNQGHEAWHFFYLIPLGLELVTVLNLLIAFKDCDEDLKQWYDTEDADVKKGPSSQDFIAAIKDVRSWLACSFVFFYQGSEVSMGGWVVTFLLDYRDGNKASAGYVSSGFWGGVTLGRFVLTHLLTKNFGIRRSVIILAILIAGLDVLAWVIPNAIASATFASLMGFLIGPIYPMMVSLITQIIPRKLRFCALTLCTAFGSSGGSAIPFIIGLSSEFVGTFILHPIFLACYGLLGVSWLLLPNIERKRGIKNLWQRIW